MEQVLIKIYMPHLGKVKKNLISNRAVYPSFRARFEHISHSDCSPTNIGLQMLDQIHRTEQ